MDSLMSLGAPLKQFTSCVSGKSTSAKRGAKRSQSVRRSSFTRRKSISSRRRSLPCNSQKVPDSWLRAYQAELKRERKRQQAVLAKKNAERSTRTHFRSHHCLPRQTTTARKPAAAKDDSFFGAFQGLSLDGLMGGTNGSPAVSAPSAAGGDQCKVMWDPAFKDKSGCAWEIIPPRRLDQRLAGESWTWKWSRVSHLVTQEKGEGKPVWISVFYFLLEMLILFRKNISCSWHLFCRLDTVISLCTVSISV